MLRALSNDTNLLQLVMKDLKRNLKNRSQIAIWIQFLTFLDEIQFSLISSLERNNSIQILTEMLESVYWLNHLYLGSSGALISALESLLLISLRKSIWTKSLKNK